jgi:antitoxin HigA-1
MRKLKKSQQIHQGEVLREDFMKPFRLSMNKLALELHVPVTRIAEIIHEHRGISVDTAVRLARYFGNTPQFWLNLQRDYELEVAEDKLVAQVESQVQPMKPAAG